jgi:catechol 2,3-dioxygenase-like lactoylglutathione lyase family enzyme
MDLWWIRATGYSLTYVMRSTYLFVAIATMVLVLPLALQAGDFPTSDKRPPIVGVAGIGLRTSDIAASRKFYSGFLGLEEVARVKQPDDGNLTEISFEVNERQIIDVFPGLTDQHQDRLVYVAFETTSVEQLRAYLAGRGVTVPEKVKTAADGTSSFSVTAPEGHVVKFVQFAAGTPTQSDSKTGLDRRVARHMVHVGFIVNDSIAQNHFFKEILGFQVSWHGGMKDEATDWVNMRVPEGHDWLEYMLNVHNPDPARLGNVNHIGLGVTSVKESYETLLQRGSSPRKPLLGRDGKWQVALVDADLTRVEIMEFKPVETPCCSPMLP